MPECIICGDKRTDGFECLECDEFICLECSSEDETSNSQFICCCCHKYEFEPFRIFNSIGKSDFDEWLKKYIDRRTKLAIKVEEQLKSSVDGFVSSIYSRLPSITAVLKISLMLAITSEDRDDLRNPYFKKAKRELKDFEKIEFERFKDELKRFLSDEMYIPYLPTHRIRININDPLIDEFKNMEVTLLSRWNPELFKIACKIYLDKSSDGIDSFKKLAFDKSKENWKKILEIPQLGKAEGICEICNTGILFLNSNDNLQCSNCGREYCFKCLEEKLDSHTCSETRLKEIAEMRSVSTVCPFCGRRIQKVEGTCDDMFCNFCHRGFDYRTRNELKYEFENPERKEWLESQGRTYDTQLSSQIRKFNFEMLDDLLTSIIFARASAEIRPFISIVKVINIGKRMMRIRSIYKHGISKQKFNVYNNFVVNELIDFIYMYIETIVRIIEEETSQNILIMNVELDQIFNHLNYLITIDNESVIRSNVNDLIEQFNSAFKVWYSKSVEHSPLKNDFTIDVHAYRMILDEELLMKLDRFVDPWVELIKRIPSHYRQNYCSKGRVDRNHKLQICPPGKRFYFYLKLNEEQNRFECERKNETIILTNEAINNSKFRFEICGISTYHSKTFTLED